MFKITKEDINPKYAIDLLKDSDCVFFHKHYIKILWGSHAAFALINFQLWLVTMLLPAFVAFHSFSINTSLNHIKFMGYQSFKTKDDSVNSLLTWFITFGEAWHNNHHADPKSANYGKKWWELDPTYWLIKLIRSK
jgi:stearoyl-CoA desaturase (delta-9 desaturase)